VASFYTKNTSAPKALRHFSPKIYFSNNFKRTIPIWEKVNVVITRQQQLFMCGLFSTPADRFLISDSGHGHFHDPFLEIFTFHRKRIIFSFSVDTFLKRYPSPLVCATISSR